MIHNLLFISVPKTCEGYLKLGVAASDELEIDPDRHSHGREPFKVGCQFKKGL